MEKFDEKGFPKSHDYSCCTCGFDTDFLDHIEVPSGDFYCIECFKDWLEDNLKELSNHELIDLYDRLSAVTGHVQDQYNIARNCWFSLRNEIKQRLDENQD